VPQVATEVGRTLDPDRNPYFAGAALRLFVCYRDGAPVARLSVTVNPAHERAFGVRAGFFGFFESENDGEAARRLFGEAEAFCRARGATVLEGPFNPHHYSELGLQVDRFGTRRTTSDAAAGPWPPQVARTASRSGRSRSGTGPETWRSCARSTTTPSPRTGISCP
jgi:hypothetical protein